MKRELLHLVKLFVKYRLFVDLHLEISFRLFGTNETLKINSL